MNKVALEIFETGMVKDRAGRSRKVHSHIPIEQCEFIQAIIGEIGAKTTLEVGLAFGISTLFICDALTKLGGTRHYVMDPLQGEWDDIGLANLERSGFNGIVDFRRDYSHRVLPMLHQEGVKIDFAFVDTTKIFDVVMIDFYFIMLMLREGGIIVFDDCSWPGLRKLMRYLAYHPALRVYKTCFAEEDRWRRRLLSKICNMVPKKDRLFSNSLLVLDSTLGVNAKCVAFQKISEDTRGWDWFEDF